MCFPSPYSLSGVLLGNAIELLLLDESMINDVRSILRFEFSTNLCDQHLSISGKLVDKYFQISLNLSRATSHGAVVSISHNPFFVSHAPFLPDKPGPHLSQLFEQPTANKYFVQLTSFSFSVITEVEEINRFFRLTCGHLCMQTFTYSSVQCAIN